MTNIKAERMVSVRLIGQFSIGFYWCDDCQSGERWLSFKSWQEEEAMRLVDLLNDRGIASTYESRTWGEKGYQIVIADGQTEALAKAITED